MTYADYCMDKIGEVTRERDRLRDVIGWLCNKSVYYCTHERRLMGLGDGDEHDGCHRCGRGEFVSLTAEFQRLVRGHFASYGVEVPDAGASAPGHDWPRFVAEGRCPHCDSLEAAIACGHEWEAQECARELRGLNLTPSSRPLRPGETVTLTGPCRCGVNGLLDGPAERRGKGASDAN